MNKFDILINAISCAGSDPERVVMLLERIIAYRDEQVQDFSRLQNHILDLRDDNAELDVRNRELTNENEDLRKRIAELEAAGKPTITINWSNLFKQAVQLRDRWIDYIKWVRNEGVVLSDGERIGLYEANYIAEYVLSYFDYKPIVNLPFRGENTGRIGWDSDFEELKEALERLINFNLPTYKLVWTD